MEPLTTKDLQGYIEELLTTSCGWKANGHSELPQGNLLRSKNFRICLGLMTKRVDPVLGRGPSSARLSAEALTALLNGRRARQPSPHNQERSLEQAALNR